MKTLPWFLAAFAIGIAAYVIGNTPGPQYATGSDNIEDAARNTAKWGSKKRLSGKGTKLLGKLKTGIGNAAGNSRLADGGADDQVYGAAKNTAGKLAQAAGKTLHDFNR